MDQQQIQIEQQDVIAALQVQLGAALNDATNAHARASALARQIEVMRKTMVMKPADDAPSNVAPIEAKAKA
jgi:hypothetical protein